MVTRLLRLSEAPKPADAADALALAICHIWRVGAAGRIEAALAARGGHIPGCGATAPHRGAATLPPHAVKRR